MDEEAQIKKALPALRFQIGSSPNKVLIQFSDLVSYVELYPHVAEEFAKALKSHAKKARK